MLTLSLSPHQHVAHGKGAMGEMPGIPRARPRASGSQPRTEGGGGQLDAEAPRDHMGAAVLMRQSRVGSGAAGAVRELPSADEALPGRGEPVFPVTELHAVLGTRLRPPFPDGLEVVVFGMGSFWSAERRFWQEPGVWSTTVGYAGGWTRNPTYEEVSTGRTGHAQVVEVIFPPSGVSYERLLQIFWTQHDPTQRMRQGHDVGSLYRSMILFRQDHQRLAAERGRTEYQEALWRAGFGEITTEIVQLRAVYPAEAYHQQYLHRVPDGYCGLGGTGVAYPTAL